MDRIYCERFCFNWPVSLFFEEREIKRERERERKMESKFNSCTTLLWTASRQH